MGMIARTVPWLVEEIGEEGPYAVEKVFVQVVDDSGRTWNHYFMFNSQEEAEPLVEKVARRLQTGWKPGGDYWCPGEPVYGSEAYQATEGARVFQEVREEMGDEFAVAYCSHHGIIP